MVRGFQTPKWEQGIVDAYRQVRSGDNRIHARLQNIDKMMHTGLITTVMNSRSEGSKGAELDENGLPANIAPPESTILTNAMDLSAYLCAVYAFNNPLLGVPDLPNAMKVTEAIKDKLTLDATSGNRMLEMVKIIDNAVKYNFAPAEVRLTADAKIKLHALDPYNTFYDDSVSPERLSEDGMWAGYSELMTAAQFYRLLRSKSEADLTDTSVKVLADFSNLNLYESMFSTTTSASYKTSDTLREFAIAAQGGLGSGDHRGSSGQTLEAVNWDLFLNEMPQSGSKDAVDIERRSRGQVEVTTLYRRMLPEWANFPKGKFARPSGDPTQLPVYKLTIVANLFLVAVELVKESHGRIPMIFGQVTVSTGTELPIAYTEHLMPVQVYDSKLVLARMSALRRSLSSRGLYDSSVVDPKAIGDKGSTAQIPYNGNTLRERGQNASGVYIPLPFDAGGASALLGALGDSAAFAERISGNNAQMRGGHLPGNRVASEAARVNSVGEGRFRVYAMVFQQTFMSAFKSIIRSNLSDSVNDLTYIDAATQMKRALTLEEYTSNMFEFDLSDGLMPSSKTVSPDAVSAILSTVVQIPELRYMKDLGVMVSMLARAAGIEGFDRIPPPNQQATAAMQQAQTARNQPNQPQPGAVDNQP